MIDLRSVARAAVTASVAILFAAGAGAAAERGPNAGPGADRAGQSADPANTEPAWLRLAAPLPGNLTRPMIAIVLDDAGLNQRLTSRAVALDAPLTIAFMSYADHLQSQVATARAAGHEILLHLPMEAMDLEENTGPNALLTGLPDAELERRIAWNLERFDGYVGVNNHMGSRFTADRAAMDRLMRRLAERGLMFLDSRTTPRTTADDSARAAGIPVLSRDVFLDNAPGKAAVLQQLAAAEEIARATGAAIAIGHPHTWTLSALEAWLPEAEKRGITVVPLTAILRTRRLAQN
jgi:polysaccharide deacetylase 2 family uncharacterized protein YibQ